jgi:hypothetical protein
MTTATAFTSPPLSALGVMIGAGLLIAGSGYDRTRPWAVGFTLTLGVAMAVTYFPLIQSGVVAGSATPPG